MSDKRHEYIDRMKKDLDALDAKIGMLEAKTKEKKGEMRREFETTMNDIRRSRDEITLRFDELRRAARPAWDDVKLGVEHAWKSLSTAIDQASETFK